MIKKLLRYLFTKIKNYLKESGCTIDVKKTNTSPKRHMIDPETEDRDALFCTIQYKLGDEWEGFVDASVYREPTYLEAAAIVEQHIDINLRKLYPGELRVTEIICSNPKNWLINNDEE